MKTSSRQEELLRELVSCRSFLMQQLEDLAEEEGRLREKLGWKWLRENRKYPSPRSVRGKKDSYWGWSFTRALEINACSGSTWQEKKIQMHQLSLRMSTHKGGPSTLPYAIAGVYIRRTPCLTEEKALLLAAQGMGRFLAALSKVPAVDDESLRQEYYRVQVNQTEYQED